MLQRLNSRMSLILFVFGQMLAVSAQAQTVNNDSYSVNVNGYLVVPQATGVLANDVGFNAATDRLESFDTVSKFGARVGMVGDGSMLYDPVPGFRGKDSFTYSVRTAIGSNTAVVTIDVTGNTVWFVDDNALPGGDGTSNSPFADFDQLDGANGVGDVDAAGDTIFVFDGSYAASIDLEPGQKLIGHSEGLTLVGMPNINVFTTPILNSAAGNSVIKLVGAGNQVRGFNINNSSGKAITGTAVSGFVLSNLQITSSASNTGAIELINTGGGSFNAVAISGSIPVANAAINFPGNAGNINLLNTNVTSTGGYVLQISGNSGAIAFDAASSLVSNSTRGLIISGSSGSVVLGSALLVGGAMNEPLVRLMGNSVASLVHFQSRLHASAMASNSTALYSNGGRLKLDSATNALMADDGSVLDFAAVELVNPTSRFTTLTGRSTHGGDLIKIIEPVGANDMVVTGTTEISAALGSTAIRVESAAASGFALQMNKLIVSNVQNGIVLQNAQIEVQNASSSIIVAAGAVLRCNSGTALLNFVVMNAAGGSNAFSANSCAGTVSGSGTLTSVGGANNHVVDIVNSTLQLIYNGTVNKTSSGRAVNIDGYAGVGAIIIQLVKAEPVSGGISIRNSSGPVSFTNTELGQASSRFSTTPLVLQGNTGAVSLGNYKAFTNGAPALDISYANASPGLVRTVTGSILDVSGAATALLVSHATNQALDLSFNQISNPGAGTHAVNVNRASGSLKVSGNTTIGAKAVAGIQITNSSLVSSFKSVDIDAAFDGIKLSNNTGSFTILGDGDFANVHTNGAGGSFTNLGDNAFDLNVVSNLQVTDLTIVNTGSHGVTGTGLSGSSIFSNVDMSNIGNANDEHVYNFQQGAVSGAQVSGRLEINHGVVDGFADTGLYLENFSGALVLKILDNKWINNTTTTACGGNHCDGHGIFVQANGNAQINAEIVNVELKEIAGVGIKANPVGSASPRMDLSIVQTTLAGNPYLGPGNAKNSEVAVSLRNEIGNGALYFKLFANNFLGYSGESALGVVEVVGGDFTTTHGTLDNSYFDTVYRGNAIALHGNGAISGGGAIPVDFDLIVLALDNYLNSAESYKSSVDILSRDAVSGSDANVQITLSQNNFPLASLTADLVSADFGGYNKGCLNISGNTLGAGAGSRNSVKINYDGNSTLNLQGMAGTGDANAIARINATNTIAGTTAVGIKNSISSATCNTPTAPISVP